ncbi:oligosaccharide flippase family protein [Lichenicoccus sp.]|uniref:oligosaccharide flippase family protein n=1 Tax=Lichenicoccus sp. TaxID=2781899 RepID=UPI003D0CC856
MSLERRAATGAFWSFGATSAERAVGFVIFAVILHFVPVGDVGLVALGSMLVELANTVAVGGAAERVVTSERGDVRGEAGSFWAHLLIAGALSVLLWIGAPLAASLYGEQRLVWVVRSLSAMMLLNVLVVVPLATLTRDFRYRAVGLMSLGATLTGAISALPFALYGHGALALVVQRLSGVLFFVVAVSAVARWRPRGRIDVAEIRAALRFALPLIGSNLVEYLARTGFALIAGLRLDVVSIGYLRVAQRLLEVLQEVVVTSISRIFLPLFVSIRSDPTRRYEVAARIMGMMALTVIGCFAIAGAAAAPLIDSMFGTRLQPAAPVFTVLSALGPYIVVNAFIRPLLVSSGRRGQMLGISAVNAVTTGVVAYVAVPYGLTTLAAALVARGFLAILFIAPFIRSVLSHPVAPLLSSLIVPMGGGVMARLAVLGVEQVVPAHWPALLLLVVEGSVAALCYVAVLLLCARSRSVEVVRLLQRMVSRAVPG